MIHDILDYQGNKIGEMELPDDTAPEVVAEKLAPFAVNPATLIPSPDPLEKLKTLTPEQLNALLALVGA